jgi:hypothetical protein
LDVGRLQLVIQDVEASVLAKLPGDPLCLLDRHHREARSGRNAPDAESLERCHIGRGGATDDIDGRLDHLSEPADRVGIGDRKGESAPAAK